MIASEAYAKTTLPISDEDKQNVSIVNNTVLYCVSNARTLYTQWYRLSLPLAARPDQDW